MPLTIEWHYDKARDAIVVTNTTKAYTLLPLGCLDDSIEVPPTPAPADLPKFLQPPPALPGYKLTLAIESIPEFKPLLVYNPLLEFELMSHNLPPLKIVIPEVLVIEISSSDSPAPTLEPHPPSDSSESNPSEATSTVASPVSCRSFGHGRASRPRWIYSPIIPHGRGH